MENPHTIRTPKTDLIRATEVELRNAFLTSLILFASDAVEDLWERRTLTESEHLEAAKSWCADFRLTNGGKEIPKWLLDHVSLALHLWHRGEGFADLLGWRGFDLLGYHTVEPDPAAGWQSEALDAARKRGPRPDHVADCALVILHQCREMPVPMIASDFFASWGDVAWTAHDEMESGRVIHRRYLQPANTFGQARWPALRLSPEAMEQRIKRTKRALGFASGGGPGRPRREKRRRV